MAIRVIYLLQRISLDMAASPRKCTPCVCLCMWVCAGLNTFVVYLVSSLCCAMYTISVFSPCEGGGGEGEEDKVVGMQLCIHRAMCCGRDLQILYL